MTLYFIIYARARCFLFTFFFFSPQTEGVSSSGQPGQTEDARRLAHRAISYRPAMTMREPVIKPAMMMPPEGVSAPFERVGRAMGRGGDVDYKKHISSPPPPYT